MKRSDFAFNSVGLLGIVATCMLANKSVGASAQESLTQLNVGLTQGGGSIPGYLAVDLGIFKKHGLAVQLHPMSSGAPLTAALIGGTLDISFADVVSLATAHLRGFSPIFIAPGAVSPALKFTVKADVPVRDGKDLNGKTVAVNALRGVSEISISAWVDGHGGDSKTVKYIEYPTSEIAAVIARGTVVGGVLQEPYITGASQSGLRTFDMTTGSLHNFMTGGWSSTPQWLGANTQTAARFIAAVREASSIGNHRPFSPELAAIIEKYTKIPAPIVEKLQYQPPFGDLLGPRIVQPLIDVAARYGVIDHTFPASEILYIPK